jgi:hypothetical protein
VCVQGRLEPLPLFLRRSTLGDLSFDLLSTALTKAILRGTDSTCSSVEEPLLTLAMNWLLPSLQKDIQNVRHWLSVRAEYTELHSVPVRTHSLLVVLVSFYVEIPFASCFDYPSSFCVCPRQTGAVAALPPA